MRVLSLGAFLSVASCGPPPAVKCTAANCSGCCTEAGECLGGARQSPQACGAMGGACRVCLPQQLCTSAGACVRDPDAGVILDDAGTIIDMDAGVPDSGAACGARNQACCANQTCFLTLTCQRGFCDLPVGIDAGPCGGLGQPCCSNQLCTAGGTTCNGTTCVAAPQDGGPDASVVLRGTGEACALDRECIDGACLVLGFSGGYCTKSCTTSVDCVAGSQCGTNPSGVGPTKVCLKQCSSPGQAPGGCRSSYVCEANAGTSGVPVCFPGCTSPTMCGLAPSCDTRGFCCGVPGFVCCEGSTCQAGNTCTSGSCTAGSTGGGTGGGGAGGGTGGGGTGGGTGGGGAGGGTGGGSGGGTGGGGGTPGGVGSACTSWLTDCSGSLNTCFTQQGSRWTGGYCSQTQPDSCTGANCPAGSSCSPYLVNNVTAYCLKNCTWDGAQGDCRAGYVCDRGWIRSSSQAVCYPACTSGTECATGTCSSGFCCGQTGYRCCQSGTACTSGTCTSGYCT